MIVCLWFDRQKKYNLRATNFIYNYIVLRSVAPPSPFLLNDIKLIKNGKIFEKHRIIQLFKNKIPSERNFMINKQELIKSKLIFDILYIIHDICIFFSSLGRWHWSRRKLCSSQQISSIWAIYQLIHISVQTN